MQQLQVWNILFSVQANGSRNQPLQVGHSQSLHLFTFLTLSVFDIVSVCQFFHIVTVWHCVSFVLRFFDFVVFKTPQMFEYVWHCLTFFFKKHIRCSNIFDMFWSVSQTSANVLRFCYTCWRFFFSLKIHQIFKYILTCCDVFLFSKQVKKTWFDTTQYHTIQYQKESCRQERA